MSISERWREWRNSRAEDGAAAEEMEFHIEKETERNVRSGMSPEEARRKAMSAFGGVDRFREMARDERPGSALADIATDVRYALRALRNARGFAFIAVLTLALGIGANSGIFSVVNSVVLRPLPYPASDELVLVQSSLPEMGFDNFPISGSEYYGVKDRVSSFDLVGVYQLGSASVGGDDVPLYVPSAWVSHDFFDVLAVRPIIGRTFTEDETAPGADPVRIISWNLWQRAFGGDPRVLTRPVIMNGVSTQVIGVMPEGFDIVDAEVDVWVPFGRSRTMPGYGHGLQAVARLAPAVPVDRARAELATVIANWERAEGHMGDAPDPSTHPLFLVPMQEHVVGGVRNSLVLLLGAVGFVLLIACANVANLLLARAESRQREIAVRGALGAGRGRLLRQFVTEGVVLALIGGAFGLLLGYAGVQLLVATNPDGIPRAAEIGLDVRVIGFTTAIALVTGLVFGLAPGLHLTGGAMNRALRDGGQRTTGNASRQRLRRVLVVSELALAVVLVVGSALMLRSFAQLQEVDPGFEPEGLLSFNVFLPNATYPERASRAEFFDRLLTRLETLPGVTGVTAVNGLPPHRPTNAISLQMPGATTANPDVGFLVDYLQYVNRDYLTTMDIPLVDGRGFDRTDEFGNGVALINRRMAEAFYPGLNPIGRQLRVDAPPEPWFTIIGIIEDVKQAGLDAPAGTEVILYHPQVLRMDNYMMVPGSMSVITRTTADPMQLAGEVRNVMREMDPTLPVANLTTMEEVVHTSMARPRFLTLLLSAFAVVALVLAAVGTYGVMAYTVAQRRQEIGIRMALGARAGTVLGMVLSQGFAVAAVGLGVGIIGAFALSRLLSSLLFNVSAQDPLAFVIAPLVLAAAALLACYVPARRATRVNPSTVLKEG